MSMRRQTYFADRDVVSPDTLKYAEIFHPAKPILVGVLHETSNDTDSRSPTRRNYQVLAEHGGDYTHHWG